MKTKHREAAKHKRQQRETPPDMPALSGFGITFDIYQGRARNWYQNVGDVKRWADNDRQGKRRRCFSAVRLTDVLCLLRMM